MVVVKNIDLDERGSFIRCRAPGSSGSGCWPVLCSGGMILICDHNEYRKCARQFKIPALDKMFDVLHALCNLLVVAPENLKDVCRDDQLASLERSVLVNFVQLRTDCKVHKLVNQFK
ncbi:hypothetical protein V5799_018308 [Amblyomma americanum]|uniref:Exocyst complex component Sec10-like alpha-helical bundle domain-containing protein n=1 Tax=Amblyomma americanum TaxID=6943 RepID=A0AAQ4F0Q8_AMBAM